MLTQPIAITALASISALGEDSSAIWQHYLSPHHHISHDDNNQWVAKIPDAHKQHIIQLRKSCKKYKTLDDSVLYALYAGRKAHQQSGWQNHDGFGINVGSSRGATGLFEKYHNDFMANKKLSALSSPTTTLGNISSWIAHDLQPQDNNGPVISHSITCSSALHAITNACAWLQSGLCDRFMVGGSEAPLTPFTVSQMQSLGVYANRLNDRPDQPYPCRALDLVKQHNGMILGEGAAMACLQTAVTDETVLGHIEGIGYATETLQHNTSISEDAQCIQKAMSMATTQHDLKDIDVIITHTPGTIKGDQAEMAAIKQLFNKNIPAITTNKWKLGHTLATSGMLSIELALLMGKHQQFIPVPFIKHDKQPKRLKNMLVNAVGFGGNAVSILLRTAQH